MSVIGNTLNYANFPTVTGTSDGVTGTVALTWTPGSVNALEVIVGGVQQTGTTDYTVSGSTLTWVSIPANGVAYAINGRGVSAVAQYPADGSVTAVSLAANAVDNTNTNKTLITAQTLATIASGDSLLFSDVSDSGNLKEGLVSDIVSLVPSAVGNLQLLKQQTGKYYGGFPSGTFVVTAGRTYFVPFCVTVTRNIASLVVKCLSGAAGNVRLGVYSDLAGFPDTLLYTAGTATVSAAELSITLNQSLSAGIYWLASQYDNTPGMNAAFPGFSDLNDWVEGIHLGSTAWGATAVVGYYMTQAYGSGLAATASSLTAITGANAPCIRIIA